MNTATPHLPGGPVPLFPLHTVLYPHGLLPLRIFEARYLDMVSERMRNDAPFGVVPIRSGSETGSVPHFYPTGTLAGITSWDRGEDGLLHLLVQGGRVFEVDAHEVRADGLLLGEIRCIDEAVDAPVPARFAYLRSLLEEIFERNRERIPYQTWETGSASWVAHRLAEIIPLEIPDKLAILRCETGIGKLSRLAQCLRDAGADPHGSER